MQIIITKPAYSYLCEKAEELHLIWPENFLPLRTLIKGGWFVRRAPRGTGPVWRHDSKWSARLPVVLHVQSVKFSSVLFKLSPVTFPPPFQFFLSPFFFLFLPPTPHPTQLSLSLSAHALSSKHQVHGISEATPFSEMFCARDRGWFVFTTQLCGFKQIPRNTSSKTRQQCPRVHFYASRAKTDFIKFQLQVQYTVQDTHPAPVMSELMGLGTVKPQWLGRRNWEM